MEVERRAGDSAPARYRPRRPLPTLPVVATFWSPTPGTIGSPAPPPQGCLPPSAFDPPDPTSIVDLLKLLALDSSLTARKDLANELNMHAGADGSAEQNIALQKAVMAKIAENGGKVPDSLRH